MSQRAMPNATEPSKVVRTIVSDTDTNHASGDVGMDNTGTEYKVSCWVDEEAPAASVMEMSEVLRDEGYDLERIADVESTDSIKIRAFASIEE